jgi:hypothetical protein
VQVAIVATPVGFGDDAVKSSSGELDSRAGGGQEELAGVVKVHSPT